MSVALFGEQPAKLIVASKATASSTCFIALASKLDDMQLIELQIGRLTSVFSSSPRADGPRLVAIERDIFVEIQTGDCPV